MNTWQQRRFWENLLDWLAECRLIFFDEFGVATRMTRAYGRSSRGKRCHAHVSNGHWKSTTVAAAMSEDGITAHKRFGGLMTGKRFSDWIHEPAELLEPGDLATCDNLAAHKAACPAVGKIGPAEVVGAQHKYARMLRIDVALVYGIIQMHNSPRVPIISNLRQTAGSAYRSFRRSRLEEAAEIGCFETHTETAMGGQLQYNPVRGQIQLAGFRLQGQRLIPFNQRPVEIRFGCRAQDGRCVGRRRVRKRSKARLVAHEREMDDAVLQGPVPFVVTALVDRGGAGSGRKSPALKRGGPGAARMTINSVAGIIATSPKTKLFRHLKTAGRGLIPLVRRRILAGLHFR